MIYGCGIGPINGEKEQIVTRKTLNHYVDTITLREDSSQKFLKKLNIRGPKVVCAADPVFYLKPDSEETVNSLMTANGLNLNGQYACFVLRLWPGYRTKSEILGRAADYIYETYHLYPVFFPFQDDVDISAEQMAISTVYCPHTLLSYVPLNVETIIGFLAKMKIVVGMRLHSLIFAASQNVPTVGIVYDEKVRSFMDYMGSDSYIDLENMTFDTLCEKIDSALKNGAPKTNRITELAALERKNCEEAQLLLRKEESC